LDAQRPGHRRRMAQSARDGHGPGLARPDELQLGAPARPLPPRLVASCSSLTPRAASQVLDTGSRRLHNDSAPWQRPLESDFVAKNGLRVHVLDQRQFRVYHQRKDAWVSMHDSTVRLTASSQLLLAVRALTRRPRRAVPPHDVRRRRLGQALRAQGRGTSSLCRSISPSRQPETDSSSSTGLLDRPRRVLLVAAAAALGRPARRPEGGPRAALPHPHRPCVRLFPPRDLSRSADAAPARPHRRSVPFRSHYSQRALSLPSHAIITDLDKSSPTPVRATYETFPLSQLAAPGVDSPLNVTIVEPAYVEHAASWLLGKSVLDTDERRADGWWESLSRNERERRMDLALSMTKVFDLGASSPLSPRRRTSSSTCSPLSSRR